jgi:excisionase family DNA binding protein
MNPSGTSSSATTRTALEPLLTIGAVCELLGVSKPTLYRLIQCGELVPIRVSKRPRFSPEEIRLYLDRHRGAERAHE